MVSKKFSEFDLRTTVESDFFLVGYDPSGQMNVRLPLSVIRDGISAGSLIYNDIASTALGAANVQAALEMVTLLATNGALTPGPVAPPPGFGWVPPIEVIRLANRTFITDYDPLTKKPAYQVTVYVKPVASGGNNASDGTTLATAVRSLRYARVLARARVIAGSFTGARIVVAAGVYSGGVSSTNPTVGGGLDANGITVAAYVDSWGAEVAVTDHDLVIEGETGAISFETSSIALPTFALWPSDPGGQIYVGTYTTLAPTRVLIDRANLDANGDPVRLVPAQPPTSTDADILAGMITAFTYGCGATFLDTTGKRIFVRRASSTAPDANVVMPNLGGFVFGGTTSKVLWMDKVTFWGNCKVTAAVASQTCYTSDCGFLYSGSDGPGAFSWIGGTGGAGLCIHLRPRGGYSNFDGLNYHGKTLPSLPDESPRFIEIDAKISWAGSTINPGANNSSTSHERVRGMRVGGFYLNAGDRSLHDINFARTWNLGCTISTRRGLDGTENSSNISVGLSASTEMTLGWYDDCIMVNGVKGAAQYPTESYGASVLHYRNMTPRPSAGPAGAGGVVVPY